MMPASLNSAVAAMLLNHTFSGLLGEGELDFLAGKFLSIKIEDVGLELRVTLQGRRFISARAERGADLVMAGEVYDFAMLATRREDPDTLFFNRRLKLGGDTELGLSLKNLLDAQEFPLPDLPRPLAQLLQHSVGMWQRMQH